MKTPDSPCPNNPPYVAPFPTPTQERGRGKGKGGLAFFVKRRFPHFKRKAVTIMVI